MSDTTHNRAVLTEVIAEMRDEAHERRQQDLSVGMYADNETADLLIEWADTLAYIAQAPTTRTEPVAQDVVTDQDISDLVELAQYLSDVQHWAAQAGSKNLAKFAKRLLDAKKASPAPSASGQAVQLEALHVECKRVAHNAIHEAIYKIDDCEPVKEAVRDALDGIDLSDYAAPVAAQPQARELPPLPEPEHDFITRPGFTANQMQEYARVAIAHAAPAAPNGWISTDERMPPDKTPVLVLHRGDVKIGELRWDYPGYADTYQAYRYWDDPNNDGQDWSMQDVTLWMPIPPVLSAPAQEKRATWATDGGWKCLNCGKSLIDHSEQRYCPAASPAPAQKGGE